MPDAFVYMDESQSPDAEAAQPNVPFRVGVLVVEHPIDREIVERALRALALDPDAASNESDSATLARGYFHASVDSKNAHSALCASIVAASLKAHFIDMQWLFDPPRPQTSSETDRVGGLHPLVNMLATTSVLDDDYDLVHMEIARRAGTFDEVHGERVAQLFDEERLGSIVQGTAQFRARFPSLSLRISDGGDPGVQICDFLLWAIQRNRLRGDYRWERRVGLKFLYESKETDGHQAKGTYVLGRPRDASFLPESAGPRAPQAGTMPLPEIEKAMLEIESDVRRAHVEALRGNRRIHQHAGVLAAAVDVLDGRARTAVEAIAKAFLLVCDTWPTYDPTNTKAATRASERRLVAAFVLDSRFLNCVRTRDHWASWLRRRLQASAPQ